MIHYQSIEESIALLAQHGYPCLWLTPDMETELEKWTKMPLDQFFSRLTPSFLKRRLASSFQPITSSYSYQTIPSDLFIAKTIHYSIEPSIWGDIMMASYSGSICYCSFIDQTDPLSDLMAQFPSCHFVPSRIDIHHYAITTILTTSPSTPIDLLLVGSHFQIKVWKALLTIPIGSIISYTVLAQQIEMPQATRAVGTAVGQNHLAYFVPCHRVVRKEGIIGAFKWGTPRKYAILGKELSLS